MLLGTTFSHLYIKDYFKLPVIKSFKELLTLNLNVVRLCCYFSEINFIENDYNFSNIEKLLEEAEKKEQKILLTVGMKAPRWPEFHIPQHLRNASVAKIEEATLQFTDKCINKLRSYNCIKWWQVENEPLDQSGPRNKKISLQFLKKEVMLVKSLEKARPVVVSLWGNSLSQRKLFPVVEDLADIVGLDLYFKIPTKKIGLYKGPTDTDKAIKKMIQNSKKPVWLTELQANPWKRYSGGTHLSMFKENFIRAKKLKPKAILLWSSEYWLALKNRGDSTIWNEVKTLGSSA